MKLLTKAIEKKLPPLYYYDNLQNKIPFGERVAWVKFFHPMSSWTWYGIEYDPKERVFYGLIVGFEKEVGYFSLDELESVVVRGLKVERDLYFKPTSIKNLMRGGE